MAIRPARREDIRPLAELWAHAFPGERTVAERARSLEEGRPFGGVEVAFVDEREGRLAGGFKALRLTQFVNGVALRAMGLAAVAVSAEHRRRGVGVGLCQEALRIARERGDVVSTLFPFRTSFYRRLGWGMAGRLDSYLLRPEWLPLDDASDVHLLRPQQRGDLMRCYERIATQSNGLLSRSDALWDHHLAHADTATIVHDRGGIDGYARLRYGRSRRAERRVLQVIELAAESRAAYRALLGWLSAQRDQWRLVSYDARPDERIDVIASDVRPPDSSPARWLWFPVARAIRGPMLRVVNAEEALRLRRYDAALPRGTSLHVTIEDAQLPENDGPWRVTLDAGTAEVTRVRSRAEMLRVHAAGHASDRDAQRGGDAAQSTDATATHAHTQESSVAAMRCDAATFAQIYAGELAASVAARIGTAKIEGAAELLDRAFTPVEAFRMYDEF